MRISDWSSDVCSSDLYSVSAAVGPAITLYSFFGYKKRQTPPEQHCTSLDLRQCLELMVRWRAGDCPFKRSCPLTPGIIAHTTAVYKCPNYICEEKEHSNRHDRIDYRGNVIPICESCWLLRYASDRKSKRLNSSH